MPSQRLCEPDLQTPQLEPNLAGRTYTFTEQARIVQTVEHKGVPEIDCQSRECCLHPVGLKWVPASPFRSTCLQL